MNNIKSLDDPRLKTGCYYSRDISSLNDLNVGDWAVFSNRYNIMLVTVQRVTPTTILIDWNDAVFYKKNGRMKGRGRLSMDIPELRIVDDSALKEIAHSNLKMETKKEINAVRLEYCSIEQLIELNRLAGKIFANNLVDVGKNKKRWLDRSAE